MSVPNSSSSHVTSGKNRTFSIFRCIRVRPNSFFLNAEINTVSKYSTLYLMSLSPGSKNTEVCIAGVFGG